MTVEPHNASTVSIRAVMPPKREAKIKVPLSEAYLAKLMAADAKHCRDRARKAWGVVNTQTSGEDANSRRKVEAEARRDELAARIMVLLSEGDWTSSEMRDRLMSTEHHMNNALGYLRQQGKADFHRSGHRTVWRAAE